MPLAPNLINALFMHQQEVRKQLAAVMGDKALLEEEMAGLQSKLSMIGESLSPSLSPSPLPMLANMVQVVTRCHGDVVGSGDLQVENAALKVRVDTVEAELQDGNQRMQQLLEQNAQLEVDRDKK